MSINNLQASRASILFGSLVFFIATILAAGVVLTGNTGLAAKNSAQDPGVFAIVEWGPVGEVRVGAEARTVHVTFNRPMVAVELPAQSSSGPLEITPTIAGRFRWSGTQTLTFTADTVLPPATSFRVRVPAEIRALSGESLAKDFRFKFETPRLRVAAVNAGPSVSDISSNQEIFVRFSNSIHVKKIERSIHVFAGKPGMDRSAVAFFLRSPGRDEISNKWSNVSADRVLVITPQSAWPENATLDLQLDAGARSAEGNLGSIDTFTWTGRTAGPFEFLGLKNADTHPYDHVNIRFSSRVIVADLAKYLTFEPAVKILDEIKSDKSSSSEIYVSVSFKPGTVYKLMIDGRLASIHGKSLGRAVTQQFKTQNIPPRISMLSGQVTLDVADSRAINVLFTNVDTARLRMARVSAEAFLDLWSLPWQVDTTWRTQGPLNIKSRRSLPLGDVLPQGMPGFVRVLVGDSPNTRSLNLQVTSLGVTGKFAPDSIQILVTRLRGALPLEGATVMIVSDSKARGVLWRGKTGPDGIAHAPGWNKWKLSDDVDDWATPVINVIVSYENDQAVLSSEWTEGIEGWRFPISHDDGGDARDIRGMLFTDRGIYRPGDVVKLKGVMRTTTPDGFAVPKFRSASIRIKSPSGDDVFSTTVTLSPRGAFDFEYRIPSVASLGEFDVRALPGDTFGDDDWYNAGVSGGFRVAEFKPTRIKATVQLPTKPVRMGDKVDIVVSGRTLIGSALAGRSVNVTAEMRPEPPTPDLYPAFSFTPDRKSEYEPEVSSEHRARIELLDREFTLDGEGVIRTTVTTPYHAGRKAILTDAALKVEATVEDLSRQTASGRSTIPILRGRYIVGLSADNYFAPTLKPTPFEVIVLNRDEEPVAGRKVKITVMRRTWINKRRQTDGGPEWVSKPVDKVVASMVVTSRKNAATWQFVPKDAGYYIASAVVTDEKGRAMQAAVDLYVFGGNASWWESNDDRVDLIPDRHSYKPGDVARLIVRSPFERARAWITTEREGIRTERIAELEGTSPMIEVPIGENDIPNTYVGVVLMDISTKRRSGSPVKLGLANLSVKPTGRRLEVHASAEKQEYRPGDSVTVTVNAYRDGGSAATGDVTIAVIDEGVLSLIDYRFPDPIEKFFEERSHHVITADLRTHLLGGRNLGEKGEEASGDGGGAGSRNENWMRKNFNPTAAWFPTVALDAGGRCRVTFRLPDAMTTYRILVFADGDGDRFGSDGTATFIAKRPLALEPVLPRFLRPGDTFTAGVVVRNLSTTGGHVRLSSEVDGAKLLGAGSRSVFLAYATDTVVLWQYVAPMAGRATFRWRGKLTEDISDAVEISIPIVAHRVEDVAAISGSVVDTAAVELIRISRDIDRGIGGVSIELSSTALVALAGATEYLFDYPYGCLEQRTSAIIPIIELGDIATALGLKSLPGGAVEANALVRKYLDDLSLFHASGGGFSMWKGGEQSQPYMTALAVKTMIRAKRRGFAIDETLLRGAIANLRELLAGKGNYGHYSGMESLVADAFVLEALSEAGVIHQGNLEQAFGKRNAMSISGIAALYQAAIHVKAASMKEELRRTLLNAIKLSPTTAHFEEALTDGNNWLCQSNVTATASALEALLEDDEPFVHAAKVTRWLALERRAGRWRTTRENAAVAEALGLYYRRFETDTPRMSAKAKVGDSVVIDINFSGRTTEVARSFVPMQNLSLGDIPIELIAEGSGRMYYEARLSGRRLPEQAIDQGFGVEQTIETLDGKPVQSNEPEGGTHGAGQSRIPLRASQVYRIRLAVTSLQSRLFVVLDAGLPAGLEPVDLTLETARSDLSQSAARTEAWTGFSRHEQRDDRLVYFADRLSVGRHEVSALVRATSSGIFEWPGARAEAMYEPEVYGRTGMAIAVVSTGHSISN